MATLSNKSIDAIVVGGSAGAFTGLRALLESLPLGLTSPVVIVLHLPPKPPVPLAEVLGPASRWPLKQAEDKEPLMGGTVYFAPPDYHLLIEHERYLSMDEPENFSRPSIDALFESASDTYGPRLLGILLSGASIDGAAGMAAIHRAGGYTAVQTPESSSSTAMPLGALKLFEPTWRIDIKDLPELIQSIHE